MQSLFPYVVFGAVGLSVVMSIVFLVGQGSVYDEIGEGGLDGLGARGPGHAGGPGSGASCGSGSGGYGASQGPSGDGWYAGEPPAGGPGNRDGTLHASSQSARDERDLEIRQMLEARNERRVRRGEPALDIDREIEALTAEHAAGAQRDDGIAEEVLQLVVARNERRERQGLEPLDIEAEVARTMAELNP